jgi:hypothetical protein
MTNPQGKGHAMALETAVPAALYGPEVKKLQAYLFPLWPPVS